MSDLVWKDPPPAVTGKKERNWAVIAAELRAHPGEWAVVAEPDAPHKAANIASKVRNGRAAGMPPGEFEAVARTVGGVGRVYARYVGGGS